MSGKLTYRDDVLLMSPKGLERFVHRWVAMQLSSYVDHYEFGDASDMGRDVGGFVTAARHEGEWDNFQCKMLAKPLDAATLFEEIGKTLYFASEGHFTAPRKYFFVAPKGFNRGAEELLHNPERFRAMMLSEWDARCSRKIRTNGEAVPMASTLQQVIKSFAFQNVEGWDVDKMLALPGMNKLLADTFGDDPGEAPRGTVPISIANEEAVYIGQLVSIYSERAGRPYPDADAVLADAENGMHLTMQRRRYFDADSFRRHFRDNLDPGHLQVFNDEVHAGVFETYTSTYGFERLTRVMERAGAIEVGGIFGRHRRASVQVRQGTCHHLANEGVMPWTKP
ncbi:ABC-three component system protein [Labrys monachus]|uniref:ABC-three component systems C-terminal domain-containing protein n=1 Tax=Labrys monachus TaxID=217067 RepID=A0ABU0F6N9_9HYPH|nr:ABC-three component system protein [Labrys monachus]MDQ0390230.1 hypothetical protein [Labrys monachus]